MSLSPGWLLVQVRSTLRAKSTTHRWLFIVASRSAEPPEQEPAGKGRAPPQMARPPTPQTPSMATASPRRKFRPRAPRDLSLMLPAVLLTAPILSLKPEEPSQAPPGCALHHRPTRAPAEPGSERTASSAG